jgi:hypothetical protein
MMRRRSMSRPWNPKASRGWVRLPAMQSSRLFPVAYEAKVVSGRKKYEIQVGPDGKSLDYEA